MGDYRQVTLHYDPAQHAEVEAFLKRHGALCDDEFLEDSPAELELNYGGAGVFDECPPELMLLARVGQGDYGAFCMVSPRGHCGVWFLDMCSDSERPLVYVEPETLEVSKQSQGALWAYHEVTTRLGCCK